MYATPSFVESCQHVVSMLPDARKLACKRTYSHWAGYFVAHCFLTVSWFWLVLTEHATPLRTCIR